MAPTRRGVDAVARTAPNAVGGRPPEVAPPGPATPARPIVPSAADGDDESAMTPLTAEDATSAPDAGDDLLRAGVVQPTHVAEVMRAIPSEPVSPSARRFLRPLVGIDPDGVRIHRGERAGRLADQLRADAVAVGDDIAIGPGHDDRDPDTIALVAHELTHAARARDRRFVPPIARGVPHVDAGAADAAPPTRAGGRGAATEAAPPDDEEALARIVETHVRAAAERAREQVVRPTTDITASSYDYVAADLDDFDEATTLGAPIQSGAPARRTVPSATAPGAAASPWGVLPAPWEPLPASLVGGAADQPAAITPPVIAAPSPPLPIASAAPAPEVHLAEQGRGTAGEEPAHADAPGHSGPAAPDIDALARQVYSVLKRRLAAERRRGA